MDEQEIKNPEQKQQLLKQRMRQLERRHRIKLLLSTLSQYLVGFGIRGIWPFGAISAITEISEDLILIGIILSVICAAFRVILLLILWQATESWLFMLLIYAGIHLIPAGIGSLLWVRSEGNLTDIEKESSQIIEDYIANCKKRLKLKVSFSDRNISTYHADIKTGIYAQGANGGINIFHASMKRDDIRMTIYCLENEAGNDAYLKRISSTTSEVKTLEKVIASTKFNKKFAVVLEAERELNMEDYTFIEKRIDEVTAIGYLSPANQLKMLNAKGLKMFSTIEITPAALTAHNGEMIPPPKITSADNWRSLNSNLKDIERYFQTVRKLVDKEYEEMKQVEFLYGE